MTLPVFSTARAVCTPLVLAASISAIFSAPAGAQTTHDQNLPPVVVTAARTGQSAAEVLSDYTTISSEEIRQSGYTSLPELLQRQRGIEIVQNGGPGTSASVFIRGTSNEQNIVLIDGVRVGSSTLGGANWAAIPLSQIDRIEIVYGPLSSLYGADAMGGVVQIFTKKGQGAVTPTVSVGVGTYGTRAVEAGVSGSGGTVHYAINAGHEKARGFSAAKPGAFGYNPDKDGYERNSVSGRVGMDVAKGHEIGVNFLKSYLDTRVDFGASYDDHQLQDVASYSVFSRNKFLPNWTSLVRLGRSNDDSVLDSSFPSRFNTTQDLLSWQNDVSLGAGSLIQLVAERRKEQVNTTTAELNRERSTNSGAVAYQFRQGAHLASISLRNDDSSQFGSHTTGNAAYGYRLSPALRANLSYGTSFRAPTFNELYFPGYGFAGNRPERGKNAEAGLYYDSGASQLSAVYYRNRITDLIGYAFPCPAGAASFPFGCAYNINRARLAGWTLAGATKAGNFTLRGSLDLQNARDQATGQWLPRRAKRHGTLAAEYGAGKLRAGAEMVFSGRRFDDAANRSVLPGYGLVNLYASHEFAGNWSVFGRWNNVFNKEYELAKNYNTPGSNLFVGVRYGFQ